MVRFMFPTSSIGKSVIDGAGLPGATQAAQAAWIEVRSVRNTGDLAAAVARTRLGRGELSAVVLAKELSADLVLIDERRARRYAQMEGLPVIGCVGILKDLYEQEILRDLKSAYQRLVHHGIRIDLRTLQHSLAKFQLPPL
jgi:predicted nucleic acid-binding protein